MLGLSSYTFIILASAIIILSFFFGALAKKTNVPAVLLLIGLGIGLQYGMNAMGMGGLDFFPILEVLGIVGLIMIVLEAALELELKKEKLPLIGKSALVALLGLVASAGAAAAILHFFIADMSWLQAWLYATPLSILSSAIIIPSVGALVTEKKEFHIYESTFSDIVGIMMFYLIEGMMQPDASTGQAAADFGISLALTIGIALIASYALMLIFQRVSSTARLFLLIAVLLLLYSAGKKMHLSPLILILVFGLVVSNQKLFFRGFMKRWLNEDKAHHLSHGLHIVTLETAFVVRTFFFVIFGITIVLSSLLSLEVVYTSLALLASIYLVRWVFLRIFVGKSLMPQLGIAPRGLITVLLFFAIPTELQSPGFNPGILLFVIIATSLVMTGSLIANGRKGATREPVSPEEEFTFDKVAMPQLKQPESDA